METLLARALGQGAPPTSAEEKRLVLSRLLGRLAHEIRNPLSSLDVHVQLLDEDLSRMAPEARAKLADRLQVIQGELHRLNAIVEQFLRLAGPSAPNLAPVDLAKVVSHVRDLLQPEAAAREIELVIGLADDLPWALGDADQLIQATLNLAINSLQAVDRRGRVELGARPDGGQVLLEVRDTGPGVVGASLDEIFEPFFTTKPEGSGLGLWIAQQIVAAHGGTLDAANLPEGGAVFTLRLSGCRKETEHGQLED